MKNSRCILIVLILALSYLCVNSPAQRTNTDARSAVKLGDIFTDYPSEELLTDARLYQEKYDGKFLFRLCSASGSPPTVYGLFSPRLRIFAQALERTGKVPPQNISYVFNNQCENQNDLSAVELWWTPKDGNEPKFDRRIEICQLKISGYGQSSEQGFKNDQQYTAALKNLAKQIRAASNNSKIAGLITVIYYNNYSPKLRRRIETAKKLLAAEIKDGLITVEVRKSIVPFISEQETARLKEKTFPLVYSVFLDEKDCSEKTQANNSTVKLTRRLE